MAAEAEQIAEHFQFRGRFVLPGLQLSLLPQCTVLPSGHTSLFTDLKSGRLKGAYLT